MDPLRVVRQLDALAELKGDLEHTTERLYWLRLAISRMETIEAFDRSAATAKKPRLRAVKRAAS